MAYDEIRRLAIQWKERERGESFSGSVSSPRASALRDYRSWFRFGNPEGAQEALSRFYEAGGDEDELEKLRSGAYTLWARCGRGRATERMCPTSRHFSTA